MLMNNGIVSRLAIWVLLCPLFHGSALAAMYNTQTYPGQGVAGAVGSGSLTMSNSVTTVNVLYTKGIGSFQDNLVIFIDTASGGFTDTSKFNDKATPLETAVSGYRNSRSTAIFASGFDAEYAIALGVDNGSSLYKLVDDSSGPHLQLVQASLGLTPNFSQTSPTYTFSFNWIDIGLPNQRTNFFKFETSYITSYGWRNFESFEGITGQAGFNTITFTNYDTYGVKPIPENSSAALAVFGGIGLTVLAGTRLRRRLCPSKVSVGG